VAPKAAHFATTRRATTGLMRCSKWPRYSITSSAGEQERRHADPEGSGRSEIQDQLDLRGLFDRQICGFGTLQDLVNIRGCASILLTTRGQARAPCEFSDLLAKR
jgi:hypothetical protein